MRKPIFCAAVFGSMLAQSPRLPDSYSFVAATDMGGPMTITVNRSGAKELVEMKMQSGNMHLRQLYDFQAHRVYTLDLIASRCTTQEYTSAYVPVMHDPIGGAAEMLPPSALASLRQVGKETVNGIATRIVEATLAEGRGKYKFWLEEKFNFPVKQSLTMGAQPERTVFEIRQLTYAPPPASSFTAPADCTRIGGTTSATGGHAEVEVEVKVPPQTHQLGQARGKVTAVRLRLDPPNYKGPCPNPVKLIAEITTDGPGTVWYEFLAGAVRKIGPGEGKLSFTAAGTQTVTLEAEYVRTPGVPHTALIAAMEDEQGRHGPQTVGSGDVSYNAACSGPAVRR